MQIKKIVAAIGLTATVLGLSTTAEARRWDRHDRYHHYDHGRHWHGHYNRCRYEYRHHHRVRICR